MQTAQPESATQIVERVLKALEVLAARPATPDELADILEVHRRTVTRMLGMISLLTEFSATPMNLGTYRGLAGNGNRDDQQAEARL